jgi:hypothetical protein
MTYRKHYVYKVWKKILQDIGEISYTYYEFSRQYTIAQVSNSKIFFQT